VLRARHLRRLPAVLSGRVLVGGGNDDRIAVSRAASVIVA
jgi:hypothetical protein